MARVRTGWVVYGFVLAHEHDSYPLCEFSKNAVSGIDVMPDACIGKRGLRGEPKIRTTCLFLCIMRQEHTLPIA